MDGIIEMERKARDSKSELDDNHGRYGVSRQNTSTTRVDFGAQADSKCSKVYSALANADSIRLLYLEPGAPNQSLKACLETVKIGEAPPYEAISYAWGNKQEVERILVGDTSLDIPKSLHTAIRRVRSPDKPLILWADAICINQFDVNERSHQVSIMGHIFRKADRVLVWIGNDDEEERSEDVIKFVHDVVLTIGVNRGPINSAFYNLKLPSKLTPEEVVQWTGIARLFNKPWFQRVWTVQEIGLARDSRIFYGTAETTFTSLVKILVWFDFGGKLICSHFGIQIDARYWFCVLFYKNFDPTLMMEYGCANQLVIADFLAVLKYTRTYGASDARDRIYAFLGLFPNMVDDELTFDVDYNKSKIEVFTHFAKHYVKKGSGLRLLSHVTESEEILNRSNNTPSWVPIWDQPKTTLELGSKLYYYHAGGFRDAPVVRITDDVLTLRGSFVDTVSWAHEAFTASSFDPETDLTGSPASHQLEYLWNRILQALPLTQIPYQDVHISLSLTLVAGLSLGGHRHAENYLGVHVANFCSYLLHLFTLWHDGQSIEEHQKERVHQLREAAAGGNWAQFLVDCQYVCCNRRLFVTEKGYFGIGPAALKPGDVCYILVGATVPFILRKFGSKHRLVGECYIQGFMRGEGLKLYPSGDFGEEELDIY